MEAPPPNKDAMEPTPEPAPAPEPAPRRAPSPRQAWAVLAVGVATLATGIGLIVASQVGGESSRAAGVPGASEVAELLGGIPQDGPILGSPDAPVTLVEYADLQCPFCRQWAAFAFPELVRDYVRPGKLKIEFRGLAFLGSDSVTALRTALAAGLQDRLWNVVDLLFRNQGAENSGWVTHALLTDIGDSVEGLDTTRMLTELGSTGVREAMLAATRAADAARVTGTPTFELGRTGAPLQRFQPQALDAASFRLALDQLLG